MVQPPVHVPDAVRRWNDTTTDYPRNALIPDLFEEQARLHPHAPAVLWEGGVWDYSELLDRVRRGAARLRARGVRDGDRVALLLPRSPETVAAVFAVLEAGAVYLPLDPSHPADRLSSILRDADVRAVVTADTEPRSGPAGEFGRMTVTELTSREGPGPAEDRTTRRRATDAAYVIYTSGSTGRPKGVVCAHRGPVRLVRGTEALRMAPADRLLATTNPTFDVSCFELFAPLLNGAALVLPDPESLLDPAALEQLLDDRGITVMWLSTGLFHLHAEQRPGMFSGLRCLIAGGDVLNPSAVRAVLEHGPPAFFLNGYGPTENSVFSTTHVIDSIAPDARGIPIGRPVAASTAYVVRDDGTPADPGEVGELWVGGDGVALGYLGDRTRTAAAFVPDRFRPGPGRRLYRTGDLAAWRTDGVIEFHGRRDRQVKIRGFRVELDEVETTLTDHPQVNESAVGVLGEDASQHLAAAVVPAPEQDGGLPGELDAYLRERLPPHMLPARVVPVPELPLNSSGKVDRGRLRELTDAAAREPVGTAEGPRGQDEEVVAEVWRRFLGVDVVRRQDDFLALGGTSLQATRISAVVRERLGIRTAFTRTLVRVLLDNPTLAAFTERTSELRHAPGDAGHDTPVDFAAESGPDPALRFDAPAADGVPTKRHEERVPRSVLLTGATGFLGVHLLDRLAASGVRRVHCLVRARDGAEALARLRDRQRHYGLDPDRWADRIAAVPGDLGLPRFGLDSGGWDELAHEVEVILHNGAQVNFAYPYEALSAANVGGTRTVLALATERRLKAVHHVSSMSVIAGSGLAGVRRVDEDAPASHPELLSQGYAETKWVAERLVSLAARRGLPVTIHRPHEITGATNSGTWNTDTMMCALFRTVAETGTAPDVPLLLDFIPVDYTASAVVHILTHQPCEGRVHHLANPRPALLHLLVERLRAMGYRVREQSYAAWTRHMVELTARDPEHPLAPYVPMFTEPARGSTASIAEMYFAGTFPRFGRENTEDALDGSGVVCPPVDARMIDANLRFLRGADLLSAPTADKKEDGGRGPVG
ncbi:amino acid adenylation domain-containing SDR family oxidoreductase [Streptomyces californicus]|uniref:amino acid adenylation domain-containing SDR family oxidoreductase n=1 Tax=Streptomyces californicus TaxID=67351 RepID=UPI003401DD35